MTINYKIALNKLNENKNFQSTSVTKLLLSAYFKMHIFQSIRNGRLSKNLLPNVYACMLANVLWGTCRYLYFHFSRKD